MFHARVPLLIFTDRETNLSCDLSVGNAGGFIKSRVLRWFCSLDPRCRPLIFLVHRTTPRAPGASNTLRLVGRGRQAHGNGASGCAVLWPVGAGTGTGTGTKAVWRVLWGGVQVKCWAQAGGINSPKDGTLNSYAICLLVLFHLQVATSTPALPCTAPSLHYPAPLPHLLALPCTTLHYSFPAPCTVMCFVYSAWLAS